MKYVVLYENVAVLSLNEGNICVLLYHTHAHARTRVHVPGAVAAAYCMLHTAVQ